jgi:apolipoprotein D and lipocalin family protein
LDFKYERDLHNTTAEYSLRPDGPFYAGYNGNAIEEQYRYAPVAGKSLDYLWIL